MVPKEVSGNWNLIGALLTEPGSMPKEDVFFLICTKAHGSHLEQSQGST